MEMQTASGQTAFFGQAAQTGSVNSGEGSAPGVQASWEERERRRVQFRLSLTHARSYLSQAAKTFSGYVPAEPQ
jgi:hypothetical protein